jgi:glycosyltransferase involved in cell wall biosynthesis
MRIAVFTDSYPPYVSGVSSAVDNQTIALAEQGHQIMIFCPRYKKGQKSVSPHKNITVKNLPFSLSFPGYKDFKIAIPSGLKSIKSVKRFDPQVIHIHTEGGAGWEGLLCGRSLDIPVISTSHTFLAHPKYLKHIRMANLKMAEKFTWNYCLLFHNRAKLVICPSKAMAKELKNHGLETKTRVISNGMGLEKFMHQPNKKLVSKYNLDNNKINLVYVGRVSVEKSLDLVIKAISKINSNKFKLTIIGSGPDIKKLKKLAKKLKVKNKTNFTGRIQHNILINSGFLKAADIFVTASKTENQPVSIMEAMAAGLPIVSVKALGIPELVKHKQNGFLAEPDNTQEISKYLEQLINDPKQRKKMSEKSLQMIKKHSLENVAKQLIKAYKSVS